VGEEDAAEAHAVLDVVAVEAMVQIEQRLQFDDAREGKGEAEQELALAAADGPFSDGPATSSANPHVGVMSGSSSMKNPCR
jgi:hypothetical protein